MEANDRSRLLLDIEHDLSRIKNRLNVLEDHFENNGIIERIATTLAELALELERVKARQVGGDAER